MNYLYVTSGCFSFLEGLVSIFFEIYSYFDKKFEIRVDFNADRNLAIGYDESAECVYVIDRQLPFRRKCLNVK